MSTSRLTLKIFFKMFPLGSSTLGGYFDPALDCSDVVDRVPDATDGFYWINSNAIQNVSKVC